MRWSIVATWVTALLGTAAAAPTLGAATVVDQETGFTFSEHTIEYQLGKFLSFRIAIPSDAESGLPYDVVLQMAGPMDVGWAGLAWGGRMIYNPLTVGWANGASVVVSSQRATGSYSAGPSPWTGATYEVMSTGTRTNGTHWQFTALCKGCTAYEYNSAGAMNYLNPNGANSFAFASSSSRPTNPASNTSSFPRHDVHQYWTHDFSTGKNTNFEELVLQNM